MGLTWKDAVATLSAAAIVAVCVTFANGTSLWLISSARGATAVVLVLGIIGCTFGDVASMYGAAQPRSATTFAVISTTLGAAALIAAAVGLIGGSAYALAVVMTAAIALWLVATVRHMFMIPRDAVLGRDEHEAIEPHGLTRR